MFKFIFLIVGFVLGGAFGIWFSVANPELAAKVSQKQDDLIAEGKRQAIEEIKKKLDAIVADDTATAEKSPANGFMNLVSGGASTPSQNTKEIQQLSAELGTELTKLEGTTKK